MAKILIEFMDGREQFIFVDNIALFIVFFVSVLVGKSNSFFFFHIIPRVLSLLMLPRYLAFSSTLEGSLLFLLD